MHVSVFNPASPQAAELLRLWNACMWVCGSILAVVTIAIVYIAIRYRARDNREPSQYAGNTKLEVAWTVVPVAIVSVLFAMSVITARAVDGRVLREPDIVVTGHQWWWEVQYPAADATTANEIHIPVGRDMLIGVETADVIHDFWAPRLGRKVDAIPGRRNHVWIRAGQVGEYFGACAEFCGAQHAGMRFRVIVQDLAAYDAWLQSQTNPASAPAGDAAKLGQTRFGELTCANCHNIRGIHPQKQYAPDLTHVASREMLAAESIKNTPQNLRNWLHQPGVVKPECLMPNLNLPDSDLNSLTAFLETLR